MTYAFNQSPRTSALFQSAPTRSVDVGGTTFVYRELGPRTGVPVILLNHLGAQLDNFDPRIVDGLAATRLVIAFDNRGIGASGWQNAVDHFRDGAGCGRLYPGVGVREKSISSAFHSAASWRRRLC